MYVIQRQLEGSLLVNGPRILIQAHIIDKEPGLSQARAACYLFQLIPERVWMLARFPAMADTNDVGLPVCKRKACLPLYLPP